MGKDRYRKKKWCQGGDLNSRPPAYETSTLNQLSYPDNKPKIIGKMDLKVKYFCARFIARIFVSKLLNLTTQKYRISIATQKHYANIAQILTLQKTKQYLRKNIKSQNQYF